MSNLQVPSRSARRLAMLGGLLVPFPLSEFRAVVKPPLAAYVIAATA